MTAEIASVSSPHLLRIGDDGGTEYEEPAVSSSGESVLDYSHLIDDNQVLVEWDSEFTIEIL